MAELDYAFLADFVQVSAGKLTSVGASFTHVQAPALPAGMPVGIGARIRAREDEPPVPLGITVTAPEGVYSLHFDATVGKDPSARPYRGKVGLLLAAMITVPLPRPGLYTFDLQLEGTQVRRLAFDVEVADAG